MTRQDDDREFLKLVGEPPITIGNGDTGAELRDQLTGLLGLKQIGRTVVGAEMFGRGPAASVDIHLPGDLKLTFERFGDVSKPAALTAHLMSSVGVAKVFKTPDAAAAGALIFRLARHHGEHNADDTAREWGGEFLRLAEVIDIRLDDQDDRWRGFSLLEPRNPASREGPHRPRACFLLACPRRRGDRDSPGAMRMVPGIRAVRGRGHVQPCRSRRADGARGVAAPRRRGTGKGDVPGGRAPFAELALLPGASGVGGPMTPGNRVTASNRAYARARARTRGQRDYLRLPATWPTSVEVAL